MTTKSAESPRTFETVTEALTSDPVLISKDRIYRREKFTSLLEAERAYYHLLLDRVEHGALIARLSYKLGISRQRARDLARENTELKMELAELKLNSLKRKKAQ